MSLKELSIKYKREVKTISAQITKLKVPRRVIQIYWKPVEETILLFMREYYKLTYKEIAEELGRSQSSVNNRYNKILKERKES